MEDVMHEGETTRRVVCRACGYVEPGAAWTGDGKASNFRHSILHELATGGYTTGSIQSLPEQSETFLNLRALKHVVAFVIFCCLCGITLSFLELPNERRVVQDHKSKSVELRELIETAVREGRLDASVLKLLDDTCKLDLEPYDEVDLHWRFPGATFFVTTVLTTIGYGNYSPATDAGKAFTCLTAILGISWFGYLLALMSERIEAAIVSLWWWIRTCLRRPPDPEEHPTPFDIMLYSLIANLLCLLMWALVGWASGILSLGNALYMAIITFTTVGLGDFSPPFFDPGRPLWYKAMCYLGAGMLALVGVALLATFLSGLEFWARSWRLAKVRQKVEKKKERAFQMMDSVTKTLKAKKEVVKCNSKEVTSVVPVDSQVESIIEIPSSGDSATDKLHMASISDQPEAQGQPSHRSFPSSSSARFSPEALST